MSIRDNGGVDADVRVELKVPTQNFGVPIRLQCEINASEKAAIVASVVELSIEVALPYRFVVVGAVSKRRASHPGGAAFQREEAVRIQAHYVRPVRIQVFVETDSRHLVWQIEGKHKRVCLFAHKRALRNKWCLNQNGYG